MISRRISHFTSAGMNTNVSHSLRSSSRQNSAARIALIRQLMNTELRQKIAKNFSKKNLSVCQGCEFRVTSENRAFVTSIASEFENEELFVLCLDAIGEALSPESAAERLRLKISHGIEAEVELSFLASHFHELSSDLLGRSTATHCRRFCRAIRSLFHRKIRFSN
jgi:hypothetical protein